MKSSPFGTLPSGEAVTAYTLHGTGGMVLECLDYGGIITRLLVPDRFDHLADVVLGCGQLEGYLAPQPFMGAIIGRVAGRISNARFKLDGRDFHLAANDAPNHLHGGTRGFDKHKWHVESIARSDGAPSLRLSRMSPDGEEGYPGNVRVAVTYTVTADNALVIDTEAETDAATPFSLTHHGYFNLSGHSAGTVEDHRIQVTSRSYAPADEAGGLLGIRRPVSTSNDLRTPRRIGDVLPLVQQRHGDLYFIDELGAVAPIARLEDPTSGRSLAVFTTESCLQVYFGAIFGKMPVVGKGGHSYSAHAGLCLECEGYPDAVNRPEFGDGILRPGDILRHSTAYCFSICR